MKNELIFLIGPPGCGKSTYAKENFSKDGYIILSSDEIRKELLQDEADQTQNNLIFDTLYKRMNDALMDNKNVVIDATNINIKNRGYVFSNLKVSAIKTALVFDTPKEVCIKLNKKRERSVPDYVIERYFKIFEFPTKQEGFDKIEKIHINIK